MEPAVVKEQHLLIIQIKKYLRLYEELVFLQGFGDFK